MIGNYFWGGAAAPYQIEQSLRFDGSTGKLTRTNPASSGITNAYKWSYSFWIKHSDVSSSGTVEQPLLSGGNTSGAGRTYCGWGYNSSGRFWIGNFTGADYRPDIRPTDRVWRDPSAWEHFMLVYDTSEGTNTDRIKIYSNGVRWNPTGGVGSTISSTQLFYAVNYASKASNIGYDNILNTYFDGYMAEVHFVDGQALDQYDFGEFDDNGVWRPIAYTGTYGSNGHYLKFDPSATNGVGHDHSGNGNHFTASGFTTSGTGTDVMSDTPTTNWCTWNPLKVGTSTTLSEGNLYFIYPGAAGVHKLVTSTFAVSSGKWYWEGTYNAGGTAGSSGFGIAKDPINLEDSVGQANVYAYHSNGNKYLNNVGSSYGATYTTNDIIGIAFDADNGTLTGYKNGTSQGTMATGLTSGPYFLVGNSYNSSSWTLNAGQRAFAYTPPTGFKALNTANLPAPTVKDGSKNFDTVLWNGDGTSNRAFTSVLDFQPNFSWVKSRSNAENHVLQDSVRGLTGTNGLQLNSNNTNSEGSNGNGDIGAYTSTGFTLSDGTSGTFPRSGVNQSSYTYAGWFWKAGTAGGSSNTDGSITSTVSANPTAGFSIVSYTGNQASTQTVGHGLGIVPSFIIVKDRDSSSRNWVCYHKDLGLNKVILLNSANAPQTISGYWGTSITSTTFGLPAGGYDNNPTGDKLIAYCFAEVEGYSKFGSYTGNGSTDGPFVYCGFRPAYVINKRTNSTNGWNLWDTARNPYNVSGRYVQPYSADAEANNTTSMAIDILSNGFKLRNSYSANNGSGSTYIFIAFSENPFGGNGVSPATAR